MPGGFSYGMTSRPVPIFANQIRHHLSDAFARFIEAGKPIIGICNGFQVLVKTDLLPGPIAGEIGQTCTLANNDCGRFIDRWIHLGVRSKKCIWTAGIQRLELPIAHGEGKFVPRDEAVRKALWDNDQVAVAYTAPDGSAAGDDNPMQRDDIADLRCVGLVSVHAAPSGTDALQIPAGRRRAPRRGAGAAISRTREACGRAVGRALAGQCGADALQHHRIRYPPRMKGLEEGIWRRRCGEERAGSNFKLWLTTRWNVAGARDWRCGAPARCRVWGLARADALAKLLCHLSG